MGGKYIFWGTRKQDVAVVKMGYNKGLSKRYGCGDKKKTVGFAYGQDVWGKCLTQYSTIYLKGFGYLGTHDDTLRGNW